MKAFSAADIARAKKQIEDGNFGTMFDADDALALIASHENLRAAHIEALTRATGYAYAGAMAEGGEEITAQELAREREDHALTRRIKAQLTLALAKLNRGDLIEEAERAAELPSEVKP